MIFPHTCEKCGKTCEPGLIEIGQVLVVSCGYCLAHIRYCHSVDYPFTNDIKRAIWDILEHNQEHALRLFDGRIFTKRMYWQTYRELVNKTG